MRGRTVVSKRHSRMTILRRSPAVGRGCHLLEDWGVFEGLFGSRVGNMPIQSGYYGAPFDQPLVQMPVPPNFSCNILAEEGLNPAPEPGFFPAGWPEHCSFSKIGRH